MVENLIVLLAAALPLMGSPGPATLSVAALGSAFGVARSLPYLAGICAGTATVLVIIATGITGLVFTIPGAVPVLTVAAAAYILYLAWRIATAPPPAQRQAGGTAPSLAGGYLLAVANPKAYAAIGAVYSSIVVVAGSAAADAAAKLAALTLLIVAVNTTWLLFGSLFARFLSSPRLGRAINVGFAVLLVASVAAAVLA
jgi:threonine/homoserine/homoserine lactone efflux protein